MSSPERRLWHPFANMATIADVAPLVIARGKGCEVFDEEGTRYLDATAGLWFCAVGYGRREIAEAASRQMSEMHAYSIFGNMANRPALTLAEQIAALAPMPGASVFFTTAGSDAIDTAAKLARRYFFEIGRPEKSTILYRDGAYHGMDGFGTALAGIPANRLGYGTIVEGTLAVPVSVEATAEAIARVGADTIAAIIGEPVQGAGGVFPPPEGYWPQLQQLCRDNDILLIADEVITGFGRLGHYFGSSRYGIEPDMITFAKGVTSGYVPLGGVVVGERVKEPFFTGSGTIWRHGYTYSGHAVACAAGLSNLEIMQREGLVDAAAEIEPYFAKVLEPVAAHERVSEVRQAGLLGGVQLRLGDGEDPARLGDAALAAARSHGVLTRILPGPALQLSPSLVITTELLDELSERLLSALDSM